MSNIKFKGNPIKTIGELPAVSKPVPEFSLTKSDLSEIGNKDFAGKKVVMNIFPSIDTSVCATSVRKFNEYANQLANTKILCVSADLPFAAGRFCGAENLSNVIMASTFRHPEFGKDFGVTITEGPLKGLMSRAILIFDEHGKVIYTQQVPEVTNEPDYEDAVKAIV